jgi:hypothetical protein
MSKSFHQDHESPDDLPSVISCSSLLIHHHFQPVGLLGHLIEILHHLFYVPRLGLAIHPI